MAKNTLKPYTRSFVSVRLIGRDGLSEYGNTVKQLSEKARQIADNAVLIIALFEGRERNREVVRAMNNLLDLEKYFSPRAIEREPEIAKELAETLEHLKNFNKIVSKRKRKVAKRRQALQSTANEKETQQVEMNQNANEVNVDNNIENNIENF